MLKSSVRLAFDGSVTCTPPRVRFQIEPGVDGAEREFAALGPLARAGHVVEQPLELGAGEIGIDDEAGLRGDQGGVARFAQRVAQRRGAAILPDDRVGDGLAGRPVPQHGRLALIGDADRGDLARVDAGLRKRLVQDARLRRPDLHRVVLDPARLREDLPELLLRDRVNPAGVVEQQCARAGRALVEGEYEGHGCRWVTNGRPRRRLRRPPAPA